MTWRFFVTYTEEAWALLSRDWIETTGKAPSGFLYTDLIAAMQEIGTEPGQGVSLMDNWMTQLLLNTALPWALARLKEPSTWASIAVWLVAQTHIPMDGSVTSAFVQLGVSLAAFLGVVLREKTAPASAS